VALGCVLGLFLLAYFSGPVTSTRRHFCQQIAAWLEATRTQLLLIPVLFVRPAVIAVPIAVICVRVRSSAGCTGHAFKLLGATAIVGPVILCGTSAKAATSKIIKIGHVSPQTGALPPFAEADPFILDQIRTVLAEGITSGGVSYEVQIISKDSQSNSNRASEVAAD
jgi:hypothetical protein